MAIVLDRTGDHLENVGLRSAREPTKGPDDLIVHSWDLAAKAEELSDYSAVTSWLIKNGRYYLLNVHREKLP